jgi:hypothetical protein
MKKMINYPSIDQFRSVVTSINRRYNFTGLYENGEAIYDSSVSKPVLTFKGTVKLHGTNARYGIVKKTKLPFLDKIKKFFRIADKWVDYEFIYGSHNLQKGSDSVGFYSTDVWLDIFQKYSIKEKIWDYVNRYQTPKSLGSGITLYGEIVGPGIQKNYD